MFKFIILSMVSASMLFAEFTLSDEGVVIDEKKGLHWQVKYENDKIKRQSHKMATEYCQALTLEGDGWRVPNKNELLSIVDYSEFKPATYEIFKSSTINDKYWTSTSYSNQPSHARFFDFKNGLLSHTYKRHTAYVRCVRDAI